MQGEVLARLFEASAVLLCLGRWPQIYRNFRAKSTGELSAVTIFMSFAGSAVRIFTTHQEGGSVSMLVSAAVRATENGLMLLQIWAFAPPPAETDKKSK